MCDLSSTLRGVKSVLRLVSPSLPCQTELLLPPPSREWTTSDNTDIQFTILPNEYNFQSTGRGYAYGRVKILHGQKRDELAPHINTQLGKRIATNNKIYFARGGSIRTSGVPIIDELVSSLPIGYVAQKVGLKSYLKGHYYNIENFIGGR